MVLTAMVLTTLLAHPRRFVKNLKNNFATQGLDYSSMVIQIYIDTIEDSMLILRLCCGFAGVQVPDAGDS